MTRTDYRANVPIDSKLANTDLPAHPPHGSSGFPTVMLVAASAPQPVNTNSVERARHPRTLERAIPSARKSRPELECSGQRWKADTKSQYRVDIKSAGADPPSLISHVVMLIERKCCHATSAMVRATARCLPVRADLRLISRHGSTRRGRAGCSRSSPPATGSRGPFPLIGRSGPARRCRHDRADRNPHS